MLENLNTVESTADLHWTTLCNGLEQRIIENQSLGNSLVLQKINDFRRNVGMLLALRAAIQSSPRRAIEGDRSVSIILGISKSSVHTHLKRLGLSADMLREPSMTLDDLMQASVVIQESLVEIKDWYKSSGGA